MRSPAPKRRKTAPLSPGLLNFALPPAAWAESGAPSPINSSGDQPPKVKRQIKFINAAGKTYRLPFDSCKTWQGMERRIKDSCGVGTIDPHIEGGHYELIGPDEEIILPRDWEEMIEPGWAITIRMLPMPESEFPVSLKLASPPAESETRSIVSLFEGQPPKEKKQIKFINAAGKTYRLPFDSCKTWQGMERRIKDSHDVDPRIEGGHFELIGPDEEIILPEDWEEMIEPGWVITIRMLPMPESEFPVSLELASPPAESQTPKEKKQIKFINAAGKTYRLPFDSCKTWQGMEKRIKDSCDVGAIDPRIEDGHYELIGPNEEIISPEDWEEMIEPGWVITIRMLPRILRTPKSKTTRKRSKPVQFRLFRQQSR